MSIGCYLSAACRANNQLSEEYAFLHNNISKHNHLDRLTAEFVFRINIRESIDYLCFYSSRRIFLIYVRRLLFYRTMQSRGERVSLSLSVDWRRGRLVVWLPH